MFLWNGMNESIYRTERSSSDMCSTFEFSMTLSIQSKYDDSLTASVGFSSIPLTDCTHTNTPKTDKTHIITCQMTGDKFNHFLIWISSFVSHSWVSWNFYSSVVTQNLHPLICRTIEHVTKSVVQWWFLPQALWVRCHTPFDLEPAECTWW